MLNSKYILQFLKNPFLRKRLKDKPIIEKKYFEKYRYVADQESVRQLINEYKAGDIIFEPIRNKLTDSEQESFYVQIDKSNSLSPLEKIEAIIGLMMILDGLFPEPPIISRLGKVFGREFIETIEKKRDKFKTDMVVKKLIRFIKWKYHRKKLEIYE